MKVEFKFNQKLLDDDSFRDYLLGLVIIENHAFALTSVLWPAFGEPIFELCFEEMTDENTIKYSDKYSFENMVKDLGLEEINQR
jgi:hypothetical protein